MHDAPNHPKTHAVLSVLFHAIQTYPIDGGLMIRDSCWGWSAGPRKKALVPPQTSSSRRSPLLPQRRSFCGESAIFASAPERAGCVVFGVCASCVAAGPCLYVCVGVQGLGSASCCAGRTLHGSSDPFHKGRRRSKARLHTNTHPSTHDLDRGPSHARPASCVALP